MPAQSPRRPLLEGLESRLFLSAAPAPAAHASSLPPAPAAVAAASSIPPVDGLKATAVDFNSVTLAWNASTYNESDPQNTYNVYEQAGAAWTPVATGLSAPSAVIPGLAEDSTHTYAVTILDADSNESPKSTPVTLTTPGHATIAEVNPFGVVPHATAGVPFTDQFSATGNPLPVFSVPSAPVGVSINAKTGLLTWTPAASQAGPASITVRATNPYGSADFVLGLVVAPAGTDSTPPSVVGPVTFSNPTRYGTDLAWPAAADNVGVSRYRIRVYSNAAAPALLFTRNTFDASTRYTLTDYANLTFSTTYKVQVTAVDAAGNESPLNATPFYAFSTLFVDVSPPTSPGNVVVGNVTQTSASLSWAASTDNVGVVSYGVYARYTYGHSGRGGGYTTKYVPLKVGVTGLSTPVTGLTPGTTYTLVVRAADAAGNLSSPAPLLSVRTLLPPALTAYAPANDPVVAGQQTYSQSLVVAGNPAPAVTLVGAPAGMTLASNGTGAFTVSWSPSPQTKAGAYTYAVRATNSQGTTQATYGVTVRPFSTDITPPSYVPSLTVTPASPGVAKLTWPASTDNVKVASYTLSAFGQPTAGPAYYQSVTIPAVAFPSYVWSGLPRGTYLTFTIYATDPSGNNSYSTTFSATLP